MKRSKAYIYSASKPSDEQLKRFCAFLKNKYGEKITPEWVESDMYPGGFRLEVGDDVYDWSVSGRLDQLKRLGRLYFVFLPKGRYKYGYNCCYRHAQVQGYGIRKTQLCVVFGHIRLAHFCVQMQFREVMPLNGVDNVDYLLVRQAEISAETYCRGIGHFRHRFQKAV